MLVIPRVTKATIDPRLLNDGLGDAFQRLVFECLESKIPTLRRFDSSGRDGGIDLLDDRADGRTIYECKHVGSDGLRPAQQRWRDTKKRLAKHLGARSQSQYEPWWDRTRPVRGYEFHVSSDLANPSQIDSLRSEIQEFFVDLAQTHDHLAHLAALSIEVRHWPDVEQRMIAHPDLAFRWFPQARNGLQPLESLAPEQGFRSFLQSAYYSREDHAAAFGYPEHADLATEPAMFERLANNDGIVISGAGGHGKTRLGLELGGIAHRAGWTVLRADGPIREGQLELLASVSSAEAPSLLVVDYVETQRSFVDAVQRLSELNGQPGVELRFIANCRTSYYRRLAGLVRHVHVSLAPLRDVSWYRDYQHQTVRYILEQHGVSITAKHLQLCRDVPVLAVLVAYLRARDRTTDLDELLTEPTFGHWVRRRVARSFPDRDEDALELVVAQLPFTELSVSDTTHGAHGDQFAIVKALAVDGWVDRIEHSTQSPTWAMVHDVLADQILISHLEELGAFRRTFLKRLLGDAVTHNALRSAFVTIQRLEGHPAVEGIDWTAIFIEEIGAREPAWAEIVDALILSPLIGPADAVFLLDAHPTLARPTERSFQRAIAVLARLVAAQRDDLAESVVHGLTKWMVRVVEETPHEYSITSALRLCPSEVVDIARQAIRAAPPALHAHFALVAWLEAELSPSTISSDVERWLAGHASASQASFVYRAWLNAGGSLELVQGSVLLWLEKHGEIENAQFVYCAWLKAGGEPTLVRGRLMSWIASHSTSVNAQFLYEAWLDAEGELEPIRDGMMSWIAAHKNHENAQYAYSAWLDSGGGHDPIREGVLTWIATHGGTVEAHWVLAAWLKNGGEHEAVRDAVAAWIANHGETEEAASFVYVAWLKAGGGMDPIRGNVLSWIAIHGDTEEAGSFVYPAWLDGGGGHESIHDSVLAWFAAHGAKEDAQFVYRAWLDAGGDHEPIRGSLLTWATKHGTTEGAASFVYRAWLDGGGSPELIRDYVSSWLDQHGDTEEAASHVYRAWLDAGGSDESILDRIDLWLTRHGDSTKAASFVYAAWLNAEGTVNRIAPQIYEWFHRHRLDHHVGAYVGKALARYEGLPETTVRDLLAWCRAFANDEDALWRLSTLAWFSGNEALSSEYVLTTEVIFYENARTKRDITADGATSVTYIFSYLCARITTGPLAERVDVLLVDWLNHPAAFHHGIENTRNAQRYSLAVRVLSLVARGFVDADTPGLHAFISWMSAWAPENRDPLSPMLQQYARGFADVDHVLAQTPHWRFDAGPTST